MRSASDARYQLELRSPRLNNLAPSVTRIRFLMDVHEPERFQYPDIPLHGGGVPLENCREVRNGRWFLADRVEYTNSLCHEQSQQIGGVFKREPQ